MLETINLSFDYGLTPVLKNINLTFNPGKITVIIGPNAAGKSTLLKCIGGILKGRGDILLDNEKLNTLLLEHIAKKISYLSQEGYVRAVLTVFEVVMLGKVHSLSLKISEAQVACVLKILRQLEIEDLAMRNICELSGGQRQLVFIAQALVREPSVLLLDEPTNNLDLHRELEMLELIRNLTVSRQLTTVMTLHTLDMAARYADELVVLAGGEVYAAGKPASVLNVEMLRQVYKVNAAIYQVGDGIPHVMAVSSAQ